MAEMECHYEVFGDTGPGECAALLYHDFASFAARAFRELNPRTAFLMNWHIELIAAKLAAVHAGEIRRLIVSLPSDNFQISTFLRNFRLTV